MTATILLTLALGIGANTAIFTVDYQTLLAPLPYHGPDQLVAVWSKIQGLRNSVSAGDFLDWKRQSIVFQDICATASVAQRSHEIALRMALGAGRGRVVSQVIREGLAMAAVGLGPFFSCERCKASFTASVRWT